MNNWMDSEVLSQLGWVLLHSFWQFLLVAIAFAVIRRIIRHSPIATHWFACAGLLVMAICPIMSWWALSRAADWRGESWSALQAFTHRADAILPWLSLTWGVGAIAFAIRPVLGCWGHLRIARQPSLPIPESLASQFQSAIQRIGSVHDVQLKLVNQNIGPMVAGWIRPMVVVPMSMISHLSPLEIELLLMHELAHIRRRDCWVNAIQVVVETMFFYHPAVWWMSRQIRISREDCCDDLAATNPSSRLVFGKALLALEQNRSLQGSLSLAASGGDLLRRIRRLSSVPDRYTYSIAARLAVCGLIAAGTWGAVLLLAPPSRPVPSVRSTERAESSLNPPAAPSKTLNARIGSSDDASNTIRATLNGHQLWYLTLDECISIAIQNQGEVTITRAENFVKHDPRYTLSNPIVLTTLDQERSLIDFECQVRNLIRDIDVTYWNLHASYQQASAIADQLARATETVQEVVNRLKLGTATRDDLTLAYRQLYQTKSRLEQTLSGSNAPGEDRLGVYGGERKLRELLGIVALDRRLIIPSAKPSSEPFQVDWDEIVKSSLELSPELRRIRSRMDATQKEYDAGARKLKPDVDVDQFYRWVGGVDEMALPPEAYTGASTKASMEAFMEVMTRSINPPSIDVRRAFNRLRGMKLQLAREQAYLKEFERILVRQLDDAVGECSTQYQLVCTREKRKSEAKMNVEGLCRDFRSGRRPLDELLQGQQQQVEAQIEYDRSLAEYKKAIGYVDFLQGLTIAKKNIVIASAKL